jgi:EpsI family protein
MQHMVSIMRDGLGILVPVLLGAQGLMVHWAAGSERLPAMPDLSRFPSAFGQWKELREDPIEPDVQANLQADRLVSRTYINEATNSEAGLFVAWFQSQSSGNRQPHSPQVCLPGSGWVPEMIDKVALPTASGAISVNRYIVVNQGFRAVVLYWYQTPRRVIASEWAAKFWLIPDAIRDRRTDTALVRIVAWVPDRYSDHATANAVEFGRNLYPLLRDRLPR